MNKQRTVNVPTTITASKKHCAVYTDDVHFCCKHQVDVEVNSGDGIENTCGLFKQRLKARVTQIWGYSANVFIYRCKDCIAAEVGE